MRLSPAPALVVALLLATAPARAQHPSDFVFDDRSVALVEITLDPDSLAWVLAHPDGDHEVPAAFRFTRGGTTETIASIGFRLRGNTSRDAQKKSFKVSFNTFVKGQQWHGLDKLNLNGEHNDPTIARAKLAWDLFADAGLVATRAAHAELKINGALYGLYLNVEHLDETFLQRRYGTDDGYLFKNLYPADLAYRGATGASYRHLADGRPVYELSQGGPEDAAYDALAAFIALVNQTPDNRFAETLEAAFDVNGFLKYLALDVLTGSWDDYWYLKNNFYLWYDAATRRWTYLPYDYDNTFGIDFVGGDWGRRNPYAFGSTTEPRPLVTRVLAVPEFRQRFTFYLRGLLTGPFDAARLDARLTALETLLTPAAERDPYKGLDYGYTNADFHRAFREATGRHDKYGLRPYIETRITTLAGQFDAPGVAPIVHFPAAARMGNVIRYTAKVEDDAPLASVSLVRQEGTAAPVTVAMRDDGTAGDATAGDGVYTVTANAPEIPGLIEFVVEARGQDGAVRTSPSAFLRVAARATGVVINEFVASNNGGAGRDEAGDAEDWVELYNPTDAPVRLAGYTLTDNLARPDKWALPDTTIPSRGFLVVWADEEPEEGPLHAAIKLSASGEALGLYHAGAVLDTLVFGVQAQNISTGRTPDGAGPFRTLQTPTLGLPNAAAVAVRPLPDAPAPTLQASPNPSAGTITLRFGAVLVTPATVEVFDVLGRRVAALDVPAGADAVRWDAAMPPGLYVVRLGSAFATIVRQ